MSLTSYRAAPPRVILVCGRWPTGLYVDICPRYFQCLNDECRWRGFCCAVLARVWEEKIRHALCRPGSDLLSRVLRRSTIGAGAFHGRVRNGIGCSRSAITTRSAKCMYREAVLFCAIGCGAHLGDNVPGCCSALPVIHRFRDGH